MLSRGLAAFARSKRAIRVPWFAANPIPKVCSHIIVWTWEVPTTDPVPVMPRLRRPAMIADARLVPVATSDRAPGG